MDCNEKETEGQTAVQEGEPWVDQSGWRWEAGKVKSTVVNSDLGLNLSFVPLTLTLGKFVNPLSFYRC